MSAQEAALSSPQPVGAALPRAWRERLWGYALFLPAFLVVAGLLVYPLFYDLQLSLTDAHQFEGSGNFVGLANYQRLTADPRFWEGARNTVTLITLTAAVELLVGLLTSLLLWWRVPGRAFLFLAVFVPWAFPSSFSTFAWYWLMSPPFRTFYSQKAIGVRFWLDGLMGDGSWQVLSVGAMNVWRGSSIIAIFLLAGLNSIPEELLEYGRLEARSAFGVFWHVVLPLIRRFMVLAVLVAAAITYMDYVSMYIESGGRITVALVGTQAYQEGILIGKTAYAAALSLTQLPMALAFVLIGLPMIERQITSRQPAPEQDWRLGGDRPAPLAARRPSMRSSRRWRGRRRQLLALGGVAALAVLVFHLFPLYYTGVQAVRPISEFHLGQPFWAFEPDFDTLNYAVGNPVFWQWGFNTLLVYGSVLIVGLILSLVAGYALARFDLPGARWLARLMFFSYFIPQIALLVPIFQIFSWTGLDNSLTGIGLLYLTLTVPFATWLFYVYFLGLDREVEEHAWLDSSRRQAFVHVVLPMSWPVVIAAGLFGIGMMGSDVLYSASFTLTNDSKTLAAGLGLTAIDLEEWANVNAAILLSALPIVLVCAALGRYFVRGLRAALVEGS